jgi:hypothetical protein
MELWKEYSKFDLEFSRIFIHSLSIFIGWKTDFRFIFNPAAGWGPPVYDSVGQCLHPIGCAGRWLSHHQLAAYKSR